MNRKKYWIEAALFLTYALFAMSWVAGSMMTKKIMGFYGIESFASATLATNAITVAKIIGNLLAAWLLMRLGPKKAFIAASVLIVAGALGGLAANYPLFVVSRLVMGFGGAFIIVYMNPIIIRYFQASERPLINGINSAAFNTGNLLALIFTTSLLNTFARWQNVIFIISAASFLVLVFFCVVMDDFSLEPPKSANPEQTYRFADGLKDPVNWYLPFTYSGLLFCYIAIFSIFPLVPSFAADASKLSAIIIGFGMLGTVGGIIVSKKYAQRIPVIRYSGLLMTLCAGLMIYTREPFIAYTMACAAGFFMFLPMTGLITLAQELPRMTPARVAIIFSMFWSFSYAIATSLIYIAGVLADRSDMAVAAIFAVFCSSTFFAGSFLLPETGNKPN